ncbi:MAG: amidohydrolase family protein [Gammaproteobacteria bacterium]|nr:amidohydrolase family protein [Gammaproteobacteria bacterium]NIP89469.1 amidohydrolase family protein [Gammaproteobacteria bacterium]NIR24303.1 amidohydrolase family protein [Gammaproteobacteria bacterium]NIS05972.1 amidohydrolase family protein [Gammaproteobacteria bacterium]NIU41210.1 amidohydrolase family protein [Gammaproteobacteria bacterium]
MSRADIPIVDAHFHLWDLARNYHPWLCDEPLIPFRYGDYRAIRRSYLPEDYLRDAASFEVIACVYVETEWDPADPIGETRWVSGVADRHGWPNAVVAQAWLDRDDVDEVLARQASFSRVRSVRHKPRVAASPQAVRRGARSSMSDDQWRRGFARLEEYGLDFDLQTPYWHLDEAYALASDFPNTRIILDHAGLPADRSESGLAEWRQSMGRLARAPNVVVKISGIGQPGVEWSVEGNRAIVLDTIDIFGVERCMFASNFPVDSLVADFATIIGGFMRIVAHLPAADQRKLFCENARRIYRIG